MCFAAASMCAAGIVEIIRQKKCADGKALDGDPDPSITFFLVLQISITQSYPYSLKYRRVY